MGRLAIGGAGAVDWLESLLTRRVSGIEVGRARYTLITSDAGDRPVVLDDALVSRDTDAPDGTPRLGLVEEETAREGGIESVALREGEGGGAVALLSR
jgi:aminomethyltransferase